MKSGTPVAIPAPGIGPLSRIYTPGASPRGSLPESILAFAIATFRLGQALGAAQARRLRDPENHEFRRPDDRHPDLGHHHSQVTDLRWVGFSVAFHVERLLRRQPEERSRAPHVGQKRADVEPDLAPQRVVVRLEHDPLSALVDRFTQEEEEPSDADVL